MISTEYKKIPVLVNKLQFFCHFVTVLKISLHALLKMVFDITILFNVWMHWCINNLELYNRIAALGICICKKLNTISPFYMTLIDPFRYITRC